MAFIGMHSGDSRAFLITIHTSELSISTTLNPWNYSDPFEGTAIKEGE
ncbi:MAG: hypothetical protein LIP05_16335 [Tannerellaceae bacterium]|nr:hypothetical protein [Tannerellaceae bacterium]